MALFVNTNVAALNGQKNLSSVTGRLNASFEKLSSGSRINSAKDDAAGLQISDRLTTQVKGLTQATRNANDGISIAQIAEGALSEVTTNIQRIRQLVVQGGNSVLSQDDRNALSQEFKKLLNVNEDIAGRTAFGNVKLLNGDAPENGFSIQSGAYSGQRDTITTGNATLAGLLQGSVTDDVNINQTALKIGDMSAGNLSSFGAIGDLVAAYVATTTVTATTAALQLFGSGASDVLLSDLGNSTLITVDIDKISDALATIPGEKGGVASGIMSEAFAMIGASAFSAAGISTAVDSITGFSPDQIRLLRDFATDKLMDTMSDLVGRVGAMRATLGAEQNGLSSVIRSNQSAIVNVSDARSRITDTDFAAETAELTRNQIIQQASNTILAQANQLPQAALSLLG